MRNDLALNIYKDTYFLPNEDFEKWLNRISVDRYNASLDKLDMSLEDLKAVKELIRLGYFHPATPISANLGSNRGMPISCFVRQVDDSRESIFYSFNEGFWLGSEGTGIGTLWDIRSVGESIKGGEKGSSSGVIPFLKLSDSASLAISQGSTRRSSEAAYIRVDHPEIEEFIQMRKPQRDTNRHCPNLHHGIILTDEFMQAVKNRDSFDLISPLTGKVVKSIDAFDLWISILDTRTRFKGEPFLIFIDNANRALPDVYKKAGYKISMSNLCTEIFLHTTPNKSNVCCLGSLNLAKWDEYKDKINEVVRLALTYLDCVLDCFLARASNKPEYTRAIKGADEDRPLGLGVMGFHSYLQSKNIPFESVAAKSANKLIFKALKEASEYYEIANTKPIPITPAKAGLNRRNSTYFAIAPTMSISTLNNQVSQGIEPFMSNYYAKKVKQGTFIIKNPYLQERMERYFNEAKPSPNKEQWIEAQWQLVKNADGSVKDLEWLGDDKKVFATAFEINQEWLIKLAGDRQEYICQGQSLNLFFGNNANAKEIYQAHMLAYEVGLKSLYYQRSLALSRVNNTNKRVNINTNEKECEVCQ